MQGKADLQPGPSVTRSPNEFRYSEEMELRCSLSARCESKRQPIVPPPPARAAADAPVRAALVHKGCRRAAILTGCRRALQVTLQDCTSAGAVIRVRGEIEGLGEV